MDHRPGADGCQRHGNGERLTMRAHLTELEKLLTPETRDMSPEEIHAAVVKAFAVLLKRTSNGRLSLTAAEMCGPHGRIHVCTSPNGQVEFELIGRPHGH